MNLLFIFEDGKKTTFYLYLLNQHQKKLVRFFPELKAENQKALAEVYFDLPLKEFIRFFEHMTQVRIENFVVVKKEEVIEFLFKTNQQMLVSNPQTFSYLTNNRVFEKGKLSLTKDELTDFISYQIDEKNPLGIFERQEHILRLIKNELLRDKRVTALPKKFNELNQKVTTNMKLTGFLKFFKAYKNNDKTKTARFSVSMTEMETDYTEWSKQMIEFIKT